MLVYLCLKYFSLGIATVNFNEINKNKVSILNNNKKKIYILSITLGDSNQLIKKN